MKQLLLVLLGLSLITGVSGCSNLNYLDTKTKVLGGALATAAVVEATEGTNYGVTHGIISFGVSHATATFADQVFPEPEQEWAADTIAIIGAAIPAAYYIEREDGDSADSNADYLFPLGNFIYTLWNRLSREQHPAADPIP